MPDETTATLLRDRIVDRVLAAMHLRGQYDALLATSIADTVLIEIFELDSKTESPTRGEMTEMDIRLQALAMANAKGHLNSPEESVKWAKAYETYLRGEKAESKDA